MSTEESEQPKPADAPVEASGGLVGRATAGPTAVLTVENLAYWADIYEEWGKTSLEKKEGAGATNNFMNCLNFRRYIAATFESPGCWSDLARAIAFLGYAYLADNQRSRAMILRDDPTNRTPKLAEALKAEPRWDRLGAALWYESDFDRSGLRER